QQCLPNRSSRSPPRCCTPPAVLSPPLPQELRLWLTLPSWPQQCYLPALAGAQFSSKISFTAAAVLYPCSHWSSVL
ncbi:hypothetical protein PO909_020765, partial [Leuciscus waleckii]